MNKEDLELYVELAMKNLHFLKLQRENVSSEFKRLLKSETVEEVKRKLNKK